MKAHAYSLTTDDIPKIRETGFEVISVYNAVVNGGNLRPVAKPVQ